MDRLLFMHCQEMLEGKCFISNGPWSGTAKKMKLCWDFVLLSRCHETLTSLTWSSELGG